MQNSRLINDKSFIEKVEAILTTLQEKLGTPVDIEFASDGKDFYLLQCRPQSFGDINAPAPLPKDVPEKDQVFSARRHISNGLINDITHIVFVDPDGYNSLPALDDLIKVGRAVGRLNSLLPRRRFILIGPGRWGSRGDIKLGVPVGYSDISNTAALVEVARKKANYVPEPSFGTHFFQDLVESNIKYIPLYPDDPGTVFNEIILLGTSNILADILPEFAYLDKVIRVIDVANSFDGKALHINMNAELGEALAYLAPYVLPKSF
ncbi:MAG: PEP/pyruvate-binding domain-containing protein [Syntrophomonadaceae bacterium]